MRGKAYLPSLLLLPLVLALAKIVMGWAVKFNKSGRASIAVALIFALLMIPALALIMTMQGGVVVASPDTFGCETQGTDGWQDVEDRITGSWSTPASSGAVTSITAYVKDPAGPPKYKFGIYNKSDNSLVGYTEEGYAPQGDGWLALDIVSGGSITGSENYWLSVWGEGLDQAVAYDDEVGKGGYDSETYGTWPDPWVPVSEDKKCSIYATYTTAVLPTKPTLYLPSDGENLIDNTPEFEWENGENTNSHRLLIDISPPDWVDCAENRIILADNKYTIADENSLPGDNYSWKVIAINENGTTSSDDVWTFYVGVRPTQPILYSPAEDLVKIDNTVSFEWTKGENADNHRLLVDNDLGFSSTIIDNTFVEDNTYEENLPNDTYYWKVVAANENGTTSTDVWTFYVDIGEWRTPENVKGNCGGVTNPATSAIDDNLESYWAHVAESFHYITFDMGDNCRLLKIRLYQGASGRWGQSEGLKVYVSDNADDNEQHLVWEGALDAAGWQESGTFGQIARFIKLVSKSNDATQRMYEFQAYVEAPVPTQPQLIEPDNNETLYENTPTFRWTQTEFTDNYRLLADTNQDFSTPILDITQTENSHTVENENAFSDDVYYWKVIAINEKSSWENSSVVWTFNVETTFVTTENATDIGTGNATLNASIVYGIFDNVDISFAYKSDYQCHNEPENENWSLSDHYYDAPADPATVGDWGNRTPVNVVAALDSSDANKAIANYLCDNVDDQVQINAANDNLTSLGGGKVRLCDGTYSISQPLRISNNVSFVGDSKENTIIVNPPEEPERLLRGGDYEVENILVENLTFIGPGRMNPGEVNGIHLSRMNHATLRNLLIKDVPVIAIYLEGKENDVWVIGNEIQTTGHAGIIIATHSTLMPSENHYILNNTVVETAMGSQSYSGSSGIALYSVKHAVVANNTVENCGGEGIRIVYGGAPNASENILIQGNHLRRNCLMNLERSAIRIDGDENYNASDITIRGNNLDQFCGIKFTDENVRNVTIDNNSFYNTVISLQVKGSGHTIENNVGALIENNTSWETISTDNYSENVTELYLSLYGFAANVKFDGRESEGEWLMFETSEVGQPQLYYPENNATLPVGSVAFEWTNGAGAAYHRLVVNDNQEFSGDNEIDLNFNTPENTHTSPLSIGQYWWKVIAVYGDSENESEVWMFAVGYEGSGTVEYPYLIPNVELLQYMNDDITAHYALDNEIDASVTVGWNGGAGFIPVGDNDNKFTGSLDGRGYIIYDIFINRDNENFIGIFGRIGDNSILENIGVENENITGNNYVGGLVGYNDGIVSRNYSTGLVVGDNYVGGLVGFNTENVINTYSSSSVTGNFDVGGLVGHNDGLVSNSYSIGPVVGNYNVGGLVGYEVSYEWAWYEVETWTNRMDATGTSWWEVEIWTNYMDTTGTGWYEVDTWTNYMYAGPMWRTVETWTNYIDAPTETAFYSMDDDGYITNQAASYAAVHDNTVGDALDYGTDRLYIGQVLIGAYDIKRSFVYFDTSGIPDTATIQSATLSLYGRTDSSDVDFNIVIQNGQPNYPRDPLILGDYYYAYYGNTDGGSFNTSGFTTSGYNEITLNENALTWINKTGTTKLTLRSDNDIGSMAPVGYEYVSIYSFEKGEGYRPKLTVSYTTGTVSNSFYDNQTSGQSDTGKGLGLPTAQMQQISTFLDNGWDIVLRENYVDEIWYIDNGTDYPRLGWEAITLAWYEVETWTNYMNASPVGWYEVGTWTNYVHVLNWYEVETWTNYAKRSTWYEVETWTNYMNVYVTGWWEVETWTNYVDTVPPEWFEVETWTNYLNVSPPGWYEVETWTNYMNVYPPGWWEVETWTNNIDASEEEIPVPPAEQPSVWVTIIRILGIIGFLGWAGWKFKNIENPTSGVEAGLTVVIAIMGIVIMWFVAEAIGAVASGL